MEPGATGDNRGDHITSPLHPQRVGVLDCTPELIGPDGFVSLTDPRFECKEFGYQLKATDSVTPQTLHVSRCFERTVYRVCFPEGGRITARVANK
ncbi:control protein [Equine adenovirus 1]|uniref:Control protein n=1 Tax=Equine adenovirus A serotype 1 TaxID=46916 RepID=A0A1B0XBC6_ADEE1|nr:control protein [Equine adenovirus 1]